MTACPAGFEPEDGYINGGEVMSEYKASLIKCSKDCYHTRDCNSFSHNTLRNECKLSKESYPTVKKRTMEKDHHFCRKGKALVPFV